MGEIVDTNFIMAQTAAAMQSKSCIQMDVKFPKKVKPKKKPELQRILICGTSSWIKQGVIKKTLKNLDIKTIHYIVIVGINSRGAEQQASIVCKELGIPYFQVWYKDKWIAADLAFRTFKPTLVLAFNEAPKDNLITETYQKLARRKDVEFKMISK